MSDGSVGGAAGVEGGSPAGPAGAASRDGSPEGGGRTGGGAPAGLAELERALRRSPTSFSFFQAVRLLERLRPGRESVGEWADPGDEVVDFAVPPHLNFPPGEIHELDLERERPRMAVNFMGLTGPQGILPHEYTLLVSDRYRAKDRAAGEFLDIFHHRILSLFYRAWRKSRFELHYESAPPGGGLVRHLLDLLGLGLEEFQDRQELPDATLLYYAGLLAPQTRGAAALRQLLQDRLGVEVEVEEFVGGWFPLPRRDLCHVGEDGPSNRLGAGAVVGDEMWDQQSRVRLRLGPLTRDEYDRFLPGGERHRELQGLVRFFGHDQFDFEFQLVLAADEVPGLRLGGEQEADQPLGWATWIRSEPRTEDADQTILAL